jgi:hypothetical protein
LLKRFFAIATVTVFAAACSSSGFSGTSPGASILPKASAASGARWRTADLKTTPIAVIYNSRRDGVPAQDSSRNTLSTSATLTSVSWITPIAIANSPYGIQADFSDGTSSIADYVDGNDIQIYFPSGATAILNLTISSNGTDATLNGTITSVTKVTSIASSVARSVLSKRGILSVQCDAAVAGAGLLGFWIGGAIGQVGLPVALGFVGSFFGPVTAIAGVAAGRFAGRPIGQLAGTVVFAAAASFICNNITNPPTPTPTQPPSGDGGGGGSPVILK